MKLWQRIKLFFIYLFAGMHAADRNLTSGEKDVGMDEAGIERRQESDNVFSQLLRGEVTQEVKEVRHEMYYAERKSHEYEYGGGGRAVKKTKSLFSNTSIENSDGHNIVLVQPNIKIGHSLHDYGIIPVTDGDECGAYYDDSKDKDPDGITDSVKVLKFEYDYLPKFKLENYVEKVVVKDDEKGNRYVDLYFTIGFDSVNRLDRQFSNELDRVFKGDRRSDILFFNALSFTTLKSSLKDENLRYRFTDFVFRETVYNEGYRILRYSCKTDLDGVDLLDEIYDERTAKLNEENAPRENRSVDIVTAVQIAKDAEYDYNTAEELMKDASNG